MVEKEEEVVSAGLPSDKSVVPLVPLMVGEEEDVGGALTPWESLMLLKSTCSAARQLLLGPSSSSHFAHSRRSSETQHFRFDRTPELWRYEWNGFR